MKTLPIFLIMFFVSCGMIYAQGFTNQSLQGNYAAQAIYGDNEAAGVGVVNCSDNGSVSGTATLNLSGRGFKRQIIKVSIEGTYTVNSDGTIPLAYKTIFEDGFTIDESADCVIMQVNDNKLATEVFCVGREALIPSLGFKREGTLNITFKRLPD